ESEDLLAAAGRLPFVEIDDGAKIGKLLLAGEHRGFPYAPFIAFAVAQQDEDAIVAPGEASGQGQAIANGEPMAEGARRRFDTGNALRAWMLGKLAAIIVEGRQGLGRSEAALGEDSIKGERRMALGQDETITVLGERVRRIDLQDRPIEHGQ